MFNWIIMFILLLWIFFATTFVEYYFSKKYIKLEKLNRDIALLRGIKFKNFEQQKQYLDLLEEKKKMIDTGVSKIIFVILGFISFSFILNYFKPMYYIVLIILFSTILPYVYVYNYGYEKIKNKSFNYWSLFVMFIFFTGFIAISKYQPFYLFDYRLRLLHMLPLFAVFGYGFNKIKEKIYKRYLLEYLKR